jgi:hypothetical protein
MDFAKAYDSIKPENIWSSLRREYQNIFTEVKLTTVIVSTVLHSKIKILLMVQNM